MLNKEKLTAVYKLIVSFKNDLIKIVTNKTENKLDQETVNWLKRAALAEPNFYRLTRPRTYSKMEKNSHIPTIKLGKRSPFE